MVLPILPLRALTELGYKPDAVVGCSMGAVVGGMYAYGISLGDGP